MRRSNPSIAGNLITARQWLSEAERVAVLTGAGISAESGVPTFRGTGGLWREYRPEDLATPDAFARDPKLVWDWYDWRRGLIAGTEPNAGHHALARMEQRLPRFSLITQNVDGLHDLAGSRRVHKLHGDIWELRCTVCAHRGINRAVPLPEIPPRCACGALLRPGVVWFGEMLPAEVLEQAWADASACDLFLVVGTSALVHPAAALPKAAAARGARVIEINTEETSISGSADLVLRGTAAALLPALAAW